MRFLLRRLAIFMIGKAHEKASLFRLLNRHAEIRCRPWTIGINMRVIAPVRRKFNFFLELQRSEADLSPEGHGSRRFSRNLRLRNAGAAYFLDIVFRMPREIGDAAREILAGKNKEKLRDGCPDDVLMKFHKRIKFE